MIGVAIPRLATASKTAIATACSNGFEVASMIEVAPAATRTKFFGLTDPSANPIVNAQDGDQFITPDIHFGGPALARCRHARMAMAPSVTPQEDANHAAEGGRSFAWQGDVHEGDDGHCNRQYACGPTDEKQTATRAGREVTIMSTIPRIGEALTTMLTADGSASRMATLIVDLFAFVRPTVSGFDARADGCKRQHKSNAKQDDKEQP